MLYKNLFEYPPIDKPIATIETFGKQTWICSITDSTSSELKY